MLKRLWASDAIRRGLRTFGIAFVGIELPGWLGFLNDVTAWASSSGQRAFPDAHNLSFLFVGGVSAGMIAVLNVVVVAIEDKTGRAVLRNPSPPAPPG